MKVRLFTRPAGRVPSLYEVDLPNGEGASDAPVRMRCFSPPPEGGHPRAPDTPTRAWTVDLDQEEVGDLQALARRISLFPMGPAGTTDEATTVELSLASGQAEARIRWWMSPPAEWTDVDRFVARLAELARSGVPSR